MGPKVNESERNHVENMVEAALKAGATAEVGGGRPSGGEFSKGFWFEPTVLTGVTGDMAVVKEEIFGPVIPVLPFSSFDDVLATANDGEFGLSAYLWTRDMRKIMRTVGELDFGEVYVNRGIGELPQSYHTGMKKSGLAGEDGKYGLENYLHKKAYYVNFE
jgi:lactaldehyde dehydrogenase/glycolaldehyde dehydrogenase